MNTDGGGRGGRLPTFTEPWAVLTAELKRYEYGIGPTGKISYGAPSGYHDDCVIALALANHGRWQCGRVGTMARFSFCGKENRVRRSRLGWGRRERDRAILA